MDQLEVLPLLLPFGIVDPWSTILRALKGLAFSATWTIQACAHGPLPDITVHIPMWANLSFRCSDLLLSLTHYPYFSVTYAGSTTNWTQRSWTFLVCITVHISERGSIFEAVILVLWTQLDLLPHLAQDCTDQFDLPLQAVRVAPRANRNYIRAFHGRTFLS